MLEKFLKESMSLVVGKQGEEIVDLLNGKKHVNEFLIAKKLDLTINQTRNILYKFSNYGLVSSIRKKDKKKGWYTYFWKIEILKCLEFLNNVFLKKITQLKNRIKSRETKQFYVCERCNIEHAEENALVHSFICEECGSLLILKDNNKLLENLKKELEKLEKQKKLIDQEIEKEKEKIEKRKTRELKKTKEKTGKRKKPTAKKKTKKTIKKPMKKTTKKKPTKKKSTKKPTKKPVKKAVKKKSVPKKKPTKKKSTKKPVKKSTKKKSVKKKSTKKPVKKSVKKKK